ncbi:MAG: hypothetical protein A4E53_03579 [Pelotomaculum sp. PtaB.Bin104]|nr:MAG: hypothetical protein A4E53_03579 [Pelotomaculum sp. PtaB.Bin104]
MIITLNVHVLYESSSGGLPHGCGEIRLLRPLSHTNLKSDVILSSGLEMACHSVDVIIIERFWDNSFDLERHSALLRQLRRDNVLIIIELDDDLLSLNSEPGSINWPTTGLKNVASLDV